MAQRVYSDECVLRSMLVRRPTAKTRALDDNAANKPVINEELTTMSQLMKTITSLVIVAAAALKLRNKLETMRHAQRDQATDNNTGARALPHTALSRGVPNSLHWSAADCNRTRDRPAAHPAAAESSVNSSTLHGGHNASQLLTAKRKFSDAKGWAGESQRRTHSQSSALRRPESQKGAERL